MKPPTKEELAAALREPSPAPAAPACEIFIRLGFEQNQYRWGKAEAEMLLKRYPHDAFLWVHAALGALHVDGSEEAARRRLTAGLESGAGAEIQQPPYPGDSTLSAIWNDVLREHGLDQVVLEHRRQREAQAMEELRLAGHLDDEEEVA